MFLFLTQRVQKVFINKKVYASSLNKLSVIFTPVAFTHLETPLRCVKVLAKEFLYLGAFFSSPELFNTAIKIEVSMRENSSYLARGISASKWLMDFGSDFISTAAGLF